MSESGDSSLGARLRKARLNKGLAQEKAGHLIGVSGQTISRWERGKEAPQTDNLMSAAQVYGVSVSDLLPAEDVDTVVDSYVDPADETKKTAVIELLQTWPPHYPFPTDEEQHWLNHDLHFRKDRMGNLEVTPTLLLGMLIERRNQQKGKVTRRPKIEPPKPRPGRRKLADVDAERAAKKKGKGKK